MKSAKIVSFILVICMLVACVPASFASESSQTTAFNSQESLSAVRVYGTNVYRGDFNGDTHINVKDLGILKRMVVGVIENYNRLSIDLNADGKITAKDVTRIKKIITGSDSGAPYGNTTVEKAYDQDEGAMKLTEVEANSTAAFFDIDITDNSYKYFAIVLKGSSSCAFSIADTGNTLTAATPAGTVDGNNYSAYLAEIPDHISTTTLEVSFDTAPTAGKEVFVDSVIFADTLAEVTSIATDRVDARTIPDPQEFSYVTVNFDNSAALSRIVSANNTSASYNAGYNAMKLQVSGSSSDPWVLVNLEDLAINADDYKYIVYNSMIPSNCNQPTPEGELFYAVGSIAQPTAGYSNIYSQFKDSQFHSTIVEFTNAAFWTGTVHAIRFDYYCGCAVGDSQYVRSLTFCNSYEAAAAICADRVTPVPDIKSIFFYGKYDDGSFKMSYRMYVPYDYDGTTEYPFLMLLHGAGERGTDGTYHLQGGFPYLFNDTSKSSFNNIVFAPQCPTDMKWVESDWTYGSYNLNATPESTPIGAAHAIVNKAFRNYKIDRDRVYVSGLSMGGYGTWDTLLRHCDTFAAGVPLCGGGDPTQASRLLDIPIRAFHGTADNIVPSRGSKQMYDAICALGGTKCHYTALGGYDHMIWDYVYQQQWVFDWLYQQRISDR